ncbi:hypothetical protein F2P81_019244 [Scophthalmus maximus]|uniref:Uncharacterized protein n=1 Tax=Scophthalmus maximus TaxID=52904 RepID=A0A6A4S517_SCOMX|nr:hypothetical protein F2P81_019244 [Scophthalmus maximus]
MHIALSELSDNPCGRVTSGTMTLNYYTRQRDVAAIMSTFMSLAWSSFAAHRRPVASEGKRPHENKMTTGPFASDKRISARGRNLTVSKDRASPWRPDADTYDVQPSSLRLFFGKQSRL